MPVSVPTIEEYNQLATVVDDLIATIDALTDRVAALEAGAPITPPEPIEPPTWVESEPGTVVTNTSDTIIARNGGCWGLHATSSQGNQVECLPLGGTLSVDTRTHHVTTMCYGTDRKIWQYGSGMWYGTDDVWPPVWSTGTATPPPGYVPPTPITPPVSGTGVQGKTIASLLASFGPNIYAGGQDGSNNAGTNTPAAHVQALTYLGGDVNADMTCRDYVEGATAQTAFCDAIAAAMPNVKHNFCITWPGSIDVLIDIMHRAQLNNRRWFNMCEGGNEVNQYPEFGWPATNPQEVLGLMQRLFAEANKLGIKVIAPTISLPTTVTGWFGSSLQGICDNCHYGAFHDYPNAGCFGTELRARTIDAWHTYQKQEGALTELGAQLYQMHGMPDEPTAAYYTGCGWLKAHWSFGTIAFQHWCLYDYNGPWPAPVGLFHGHDPTKPKPVATLIRAINRLCADRTPTRFAHDPGALDISFEGMPGGKNADSGGQFAVYRRSDGVWQVFVWNEQDARTSSAAPVTMHLGGAFSKLTDYSLTRTITDNPAPLRTLTPAPATSTLDLGTEIRLLQLTP